MDFNGNETDHTHASNSDGDDHETYDQSLNTSDFVAFLGVNVGSGIISKTTFSGKQEIVSKKYVDDTIKTSGSTVNAVVNGLTGGAANIGIQPNQRLDIKTRPPMSTDDNSENWNLNSVWTTSSSSYICMDPKENEAKWEIITLKIDDTTPTFTTVYSSNKSATLLSAKANITDVNTLLSAKANTSTMTVQLDTKADKASLLLKADKATIDASLLLKADKAATDASLLLKADKASTYSKSENDALFVLKANQTSLNSLSNSIYSKSEMDASLALKADKAATDASLALKADKATIDASLLLKADKAATDASLALKADKATTDTSLALKADKASTYSKSENDALFVLKVNSTDLENYYYTKTIVNSLLFLKADKTDLANYYSKTETISLIHDLENAMLDLTTGLETNKADKTTIYTKTETDAKLLLKMDKESTYSKAEVNDRLFLKADTATTYSKVIVDFSLAQKSDKTETYSKTETDTLLEGKVGLSQFYSTMINTIANYYDRDNIDLLLNAKVATSVLAGYYTKIETDTSLALKADTLVVDNLESSKANVSDVNRLQTSLLGMLIDFPGTAIQSPDRTLSYTTLTEGLGITISGSSFIDDTTTNFSPHMAFNKLSSTEYGWRSGGGFNPKINFGTPIYQTNVNGSMVGRQWLNIQLSSPQKFEGFKMFCKIGNEAEHPRTYHVCGSNDGLNFTSLYYIANETYDTNFVQRLFTTQLTERGISYTHYRIVIINTHASSTSIINHSCNIQEFMFCSSVSIGSLATKISFDELYLSHRKLIDILDYWIKNGTINPPGLTYINSPIRELMARIEYPD